jgi:hypothetical protein
MSSAFERGDQSPREQHETQAGPADEEPIVGPRMLDQILALTAGNAPAASVAEGRDITALRAIAKQLAGQPFALRPVVVELIYVIVQVEFEKAEIPPTTVRAMAEQIAATLYDDPPSCRRLEALWVRLSEG